MICDYAGGVGFPVVFGSSGSGDGLTVGLAELRGLGVGLANGEPVGDGVAIGSGYGVVVGAG